MYVTVAVNGGHSDDEPRSLRSWLAADEDLTGLVESAGPDGPESAPSEAPPDGSEGPSPGGSDRIIVRLDPPGAAAALADSLVAWIRDQAHDAVYEVARPDGVSVRVSARRVRATGGARVRALITELCRADEPDQGPDVSGAGAGSRAGQPSAPSEKST